MTAHVLIATASRHGSTLDIADEIARTLMGRGCEVVQQPAGEADGVKQFDAVIVGSAVYMGRWLPPSIAFVTRNGDELAQRPVWLFSSGPIGDPPLPDKDPEGIDELIARCGARGHRVFPGRLDPDRLGMGERFIVGMLRAPKGDYRDFPAVGAWANEICDEIDSIAHFGEASRDALLTAARR
jgi:menaquinone-dependent protoporphyrinogen oxidase